MKKKKALKLSLEGLKPDRKLLDALHDIIYAATRVHLKNDKEIMDYWHILPEPIQKNMLIKGVGDLQSKSEIYDWLQKKRP